MTVGYTWSRPFWTCICSTCWDQSFSELVVILPDYALRTPGPVPLGLAYVLLVETNPFPNLSLFYRTMLFEHLVPSLWDLHMFYLLRPILFRTCRYFTGLCSSNTWSRPFGTCICSTCWDQSFSELVVILPDYALRISLGTFSILLGSGDRF